MIEVNTINGTQYFTCSPNHVQQLLSNLNYHITSYAFHGQMEPIVDVYFIVNYTYRPTFYKFIWLYVEQDITNYLI